MRQGAVPSAMVPVPLEVGDHGAQLFGVEGRERGNGGEASGPGSFPDVVDEEDVQGEVVVVLFGGVGRAEEGLVGGVWKVSCSDQGPN